MESGRSPSDDGWIYVPTSALPDRQTYTDLGNFTVDGETFAVRRRDHDGSIHHDWSSGPNPGYGFSTFGGPGPVTHDKHVADIREFLAAVDPATGYL